MVCPGPCKVVLGTGRPPYALVGVVLTSVEANALAAKGKPGKQTEGGTSAAAVCSLQQTLPT